MISPMSTSVSSPSPGAGGAAIAVWDCVLCWRNETESWSVGGKCFGNWDGRSMPVQVARAGQMPSGARLAAGVVQAFSPSALCLGGTK